MPPAVSGLPLALALAVQSADVSPPSSTVPDPADGSAAASAAGGAEASDAVDEEEYARQVRLGSAHFEAANYPAAIDALTGALATLPNEPAYEERRLDLLRTIAFARVHHYQAVGDANQLVVARTLLQRYTTEYPEVASSEQAEANLAAARRTLLQVNTWLAQGDAKAGEGTDAGADVGTSLDEFDALATYHRKRRTAGAVILGFGTLAALAGIGVGSVGFETVYPSDPENCGEECPTGVLIDRGAFATAITLTVLGATAVRIGGGMIGNNLKPIDPRQPDPELRLAKAKSKVHAARGAGIGLIVAAAAAGAGAATTGILAGLNWGSLRLEAEAEDSPLPSRERFERVQALAGSALALTAVTTLLTAGGSALRAVDAPRLPQALRATATRHGGMLILEGRF